MIAKSIESLIFGSFGYLLNVASEIAESFLEERNGREESTCVLKAQASLL